MGRDALLLALLLIAQLPVQEKDGEVAHVEVCDRRVESGRERPREGHEDVATVRARWSMRVQRAQRDQRTYT